MIRLTPEIIKMIDMQPYLHLSLHDPVIILASLGPKSVQVGSAQSQDCSQENAFQPMHRDSFRYIELVVVWGSTMISHHNPSWGDLHNRLGLRW